MSYMTFDEIDAGALDEVKAIQRYHCLKLVMTLDRHSADRTPEDLIERATKLYAFVSGENK